MKERGKHRDRQEMGKLEYDSYMENLWSTSALRKVCGVTAHADPPSQKNHRSLNLDVNDAGRLVNALHDARKHLARAKLVERFDRSLARERGHDGLPLDRGGHLRLEDLLDLLRVRVGLGVDIGDDRDTRFGDGDARKNLVELGHSRRHEVSVEGSGDRQLDGHASLEVGLRLGAHCLDGLHRAGACVVARAEIVGDGDRLTRFLRRRGAELLHFFGVEADHGDHARRGGLGCGLHRLSAGLGDLHTVLEGDGTGEGKRCVLSKRKPARNVRRLNRGSALLSRGAQFLDGRHRGNKDCGLRLHGSVKLLLGSLLTQLE
mmetsp:Transcript_22033/g.66955  ORF Transcript_22033/g.66955 Transcript_22033/m.66955 type:complete len:318 (-) Transcript_22033:271-1224(-)